jgi:hypothetical protein
VARLDACTQTVGFADNDSLSGGCGEGRRMSPGGRSVRIWRLLGNERFANNKRSNTSVLLQSRYQGCATYALIWHRPKTITCSGESSRGVDGPRPTLGGWCARTLGDRTGIG